MKTNLKILSLLLLIGLSSCTKLQDIKPVRTIDLYGVWRSSEAQMQFSIQDVTGHDITGRGYGPKYTDIHKDGHRYLKIETSIFNETYEINSIDEHCMYLTDHNGTQYMFVKFPLPVNEQ